MQRDEPFDGLDDGDGVGQCIGVGVNCRLERGVVGFRVGFECRCILGLDFSCIDGGEMTGEDLVDGRDCGRC